MKETLVKILKAVLKRLASVTLWRYRPGIIGVTGSVGKTSTKMAIAAVLKGDRLIRFAQGNFNNEIGLPLTILGDYSEVKGIFFWMSVIFRSLWQILGPKNTHYPELLILEYAADKPGDIKYLLSIARPNVSIITAIGDIPVHVEFYNEAEEVAREKGRLIEFLPTAGFAILNKDDEAVLNLKDRTRAHLMTFGFNRGSDLRITNFETRIFEGVPTGLSFKLEYGGSTVPVKIDHAIGKAQGYAAAAAAAVGIAFGFNLIKVSDRLKNYQPPRGRMNLVRGIKSSLILDDSYNASPMSMHAALDTLRDLPAKRKIAVLGDMTEIGSYTIGAHETLGRLAADVVDILVTVGPRGKIIAESAQKTGLNKKNIQVFEDVDEAKKPIRELIRKGDLVLVKASHIIQLNEIVEEIQELREFHLEKKED
ncbi:MAG: UDP-N-acetylmuramoyl-tripeptide--D-alanyl-D-alanine ligase [Candidatus Liptonbacteria bacterium]|nr:UDP-N-acetylmuramoyl-tripeptide--D-alanyl-D-alanine ligase [Candidatus Liptonbacteria bacterium]